MHRIIAAVVCLAAVPLAAEDKAKEKEKETVRTADAAIDAGLRWLDGHANKNGSWGKRHTIAVTGLACLAHLGASDEPFVGDRGQALVRALAFLMGQAQDGMFPKQGHTWIHGQGFATLALAEAYGRATRCKTRPDLDLKKLEAVALAAIRSIQKHQSDSGGWWYSPGSRHQHEGSTTVCAVQALAAARNYGLAVDKKVLERGFEYLKKCQNPDGGFDYMMGPGTTSMKEGTAAGIATLALMKRFDYRVMVQGVAFLHKIGPDTISRERFPYYGHFYGCMGMKLFGEEMGAKKKTEPYIDKALGTLISWQQRDGAWPQKGWMVRSGGEDGGYATAFATLALTIPRGHLSVFNRVPPKRS